MERLKIIVDGKEITKRYVGDKLVWRSLVKLETIRFAYVRASFSEKSLIFYIKLNEGVDGVRMISFDDTKIYTFSQIEALSYSTNVKFATLEDLKNVLKQLGWEVRDGVDKTGVVITTWRG